jgi:hypothetical protein
MWLVLAINILLLLVSSIFVAEVSMTEEVVVFLLTALCIFIL